MKVVSSGLILAVMPPRNHTPRARYQVGELEGGVVHRTASYQTLKVVSLDESVDQPDRRGPALQHLELVIGQQPLIVREYLELAAVAYRRVENDRGHRSDEGGHRVIQKAVLSGRRALGRTLTGELLRLWPGLAQHVQASAAFFAWDALRRRA
ncbi:hypothetical protein G3I32_19625 [Streptomyces coelicoflavus]|uniref:Uncharacterized protein n=1 Tax=Streptomyces coelicoflavus TaxID=285562 RepID=A0A7K3PKB6_9ACTN|nr:hypothetical protein [Streptomyces coelicoflavus]NEB10297.1 hypothetical protein [Streptomyces coelicoflavus]NEB11023.1 hypothetical protein [Streptomyces coelicoflavus]